MGKLIGIVSGKGGSGKTTITEISATFINRYYDIDVAVIDVDGQLSIYEDRQTEIKNMKNDDIPLLKEYAKLRELNKNLYPIYKAKPTDLKEIAEITKKHELIFIDIPGSFEVEGVPELLFFLNYGFVPFSGERKAFRSHMETLSKLQIVKNDSRSLLKDFGVFINEFHEVKNRQEQIGLLNYFESQKLNVLSPIYYDINYRRGLCSTVKPVVYSTGNKSFKNFIDDLLKIINLK